MYEKMYFILFNAPTDAIALIESGENQKVLEVLMKAQQRSEDCYITWEVGES